MSDIVLSKKDFAAQIGVDPSRVSQYLAEGKIFGDAIVGEGRHAQIREALAREQLRQTLDTDQRIGANARARLDDEPPQGPSSPAQPSLDDKLKRERLEQLELANERAREERSARAGTYINAEDARREMGRVATELLTIFESALAEFATAIAAQSNLTSRDAIHVLRTAWRSIRESASDREAARAGSLGALVRDAPEETRLKETTTGPGGEAIA